MIDVELMKSDFLSCFQDKMCKRGISDVQKSDSVKSFIQVLQRHIFVMGNEHIPTIDWVHQWFNAHVDEANRCGCYIDQKCMVCNPMNKTIILFGDCDIDLTLTNLDLWYIVCQDNSKLRVRAHRWACANIYIKGNASATIAFADEHTRLKIKDWRE